ncbi:hypothetical protein D9758_014027 [Tetrapyrgos nigripes]|uniref:DUF6699 domain-containing protein n=1 Tax=Tetrapyrgos nigripes TaxID=182062 RepID=A0A8H5FUV6_9AGAR|nr:hypothetical protein D9758_014027 [Tetrapyrgos nigripes]
MPGKHVRFATLPTLHTTSTVTPPSPSRLSHSSHYYGSPHSPSYHDHRHHSESRHGSTSPRSPYSYSSRGPQLHKYLVYSHSHPGVRFDVRLPPSTMTISSSSTYIPQRTLSEPAISPPVASLTLSIPHLSPHWRIFVTPSNGVFITLRDVFDAVYYTLRTRITESEYRSIRSPDDLKRVNRAYVDRYRKVGERDKYVGEAEKQGGVRRVDFLAGHTRFEGISVMSDGRTYVLHMS